MVMKPNDQTGSNNDRLNIDVRGLNACQKTMSNFLNLSLLIDVNDLQLEERLEIINILEQLALLLKQLRIQHTLPQSIEIRPPEKLF